MSFPSPLSPSSPSPSPTHLCYKSGVWQCDSTGQELGCVAANPQLTISIVPIGEQL